jgi:hypothetical protein
MSNFGKITRILRKTVLFFVVFIVVLISLLYLALQSPQFQTWAAKKATTYLSNELGVQIKIEKLKISLIKNITLQGVFMSDQHNDTLLYGKSITVNVSGFNYNKHQLNLDEVELSNLKIKLLRYKNEADFNYQFLVNYFSFKDSTKIDTLPSSWKITYGALKLNDIDFTYRQLSDTVTAKQNMNYNNLHVSKINGEFTNIAFKADTIFAQITNLSAHERCGIQLSNLTTSLKISSSELSCGSLYLKTSNSLVKGKLKFKYDTWADYQDFINKVYMKYDIKDSSYVNFKDIAYFAPVLNNFTELIYVKGSVKGFVNDLSGSNISLGYRNHTRFIGDLSITGLPDINKSYIHFDADKLSTSKFDLDKFPLPPFNNPSFLNLPSELSKLGIVTYKGKFDGFITDFATYGTFKTDIGIIKTDLQLSTNNHSKLIEYKGEITTTSFNLAKLFPENKSLGPISLSTKIKGKGVTLKDLDITFNGLIQSVLYNNYQYNNVNFDGLFNKQLFTGNIASRDTNANFNFNGTIDFKNKVPKMDFISTITNFDLDKTHFSTSQLNGKLSTQVLINLNGNSIDNLSGQINLDNTIYKNEIKTYKLSRFNLELNKSTSFKNKTLV